MGDNAKKKKPWFRSNKGQYKKIVLAVYPKEQEEGIVQHNVSKLLFYAMTTPSELEPIGAFIEKRLREDLAKRRLGWVEVGARALNELTKACHKDLHLFAPHVMAVMRLLFDDERVEMNILSVDIFKRFAEFQDEVSQFDLDKFVPYFERMASPARAGADAARLRAAGLEALDAYVARVADPDAFVLSRIDAPPGPPSALVGVLLAALTAPRDKDSERAADAAASCLRDLGQRANHLTTRVLVSAVLAYADDKRLWGTPAAPDTLKTLCLAIPPQFDHLTATRMLQHVDSSPLAVRAAIVNAITAVMRGSIPSMVELVHSLLRHLQHPDAAPADAPAEAAVHEAIVSCIGTASKRVSDSTQRLEAIAYLLDKFPLCPTPLSRRSLAAALTVLGESLERDRPRAVSQAVMSAAVALLAHKEEEVRRAALALVLQLLGLVLSAAPANAPTSPVPEQRAVLRPTANFARDMLLGTQGDLLRSGLYHHAQLPANTPRSYALISRVLALLLRSLGAQELALSFPLVFRLQSRLAKLTRKDADQATQLMALSGHALVAAYLQCAARVFACRELEEQVRSAVKRRKGALGRLKVDDDGTLSVADGSGSVSVLDERALFARDAAADALCRAAALAAQQGDGLRAALDAKYRSKSVKHRALPSDRRAARDILGPLMRPNGALALSRRATMRPSAASLRGVPHERRAEAGAVTPVALRRAAAGGADDDAVSPRSGRSVNNAAAAALLPASVSSVAPLLSPVPTSFAEALRAAHAAQDNAAASARLVASALETAPTPSPYSVLAEGLAFPALQLAY